MSELKKCPFCGAEAKMVGGPEDWHPTSYDPDSGGDPYSIVCTGCECGMVLVFWDSDEAIAVWNRRAQPENEPLTETERAVAGMIENECMRENLTALCKSYGVTEADFFGFLYRNTPAPGKEE